MAFVLSGNQLVSVSFLTPSEAPHANSPATISSKNNGKQIELPSNYTQHADNLLRFGRRWLRLQRIFFHPGSCNGESLMYILATTFHSTFAFSLFASNSWICHKSDRSTMGAAS